ncbi:MAG: PaaI family thioesterase [Oscillospiraceae bacterium]|nr:PaaI family thioesterase [Oscillospiraceae bacterium]
MNYESRDSLAKIVGFEVVEVRENGLLIRAENKKDFCNAYGFAHGGFVYTVGHLAAIASAEVCLGRKTVVTEASCEYLASLKGEYAYAETALLRSGGSRIEYRVYIRDDLGRDCFRQVTILKEVEHEEVTVSGKQPTLFMSKEGDPVDEVTGLAYPRQSPFFATTCHCFMTGRGESGMKYSVDLLDDVYDVYGTAHGGVIYTCCDACAGGSMAMLLEKRPVTVSSSIHYLRPATEGPVTVEAKLVRNGKQLVFYDLDITDAKGELIGVAQFIMQGVEYKANLPQGYQNKAFKE